MDELDKKEAQCRSKITGGTCTTLVTEGNFNNRMLWTGEKKQRNVGQDVCQVSTPHACMHKGSFEREEGRKRGPREKRREGEDGEGNIDGEKEGERRERRGGRVQGTERERERE